MTILVSTTSVKRTFSALKLIKTYSRNKTGKAQLSALVSMAVEKDLSLELKRADVLYNHVTGLFVKKERRMDLMMISFDGFLCIFTRRAPTRGLKGGLEFWYLPLLSKLYASIEKQQKQQNCDYCLAVVSKPWTALFVVCWCRPVHRIETERRS